MTDPARGWEAEASNDIARAILRRCPAEDSAAMNRIGLHADLTTIMLDVFRAGVASRTSTRVCAQGHTQDPLWSTCRICDAFDAGVAQERERCAQIVETWAAGLVMNTGGHEADERRWLIGALRTPSATTEGG